MEFCPKNHRFPQKRLLSWWYFTLPNCLLSRNPDKQRTFHILPQSPKMTPKKVLCQRAKSIILFWGNPSILALFTLFTFFLLLSDCLSPAPALSFSCYRSDNNHSTFSVTSWKSANNQCFRFFLSLSQGSRYYSKRHKSQKETLQCDKCYHYARSLILEVKTMRKMPWERMRGCASGHSTFYLATTL